MFLQCAPSAALFAEGFPARSFDGRFLHSDGRSADEEEINLLVYSIIC